MTLVGSDDPAASDDELVAAAQFGDERAFETLYRRYRADVRALCSRSLRDLHTTEDVTQETFLRAFRHIGDFERGRPVWPWLATIAKRLCIDELRGITRRAALGRTVHDAANVVYDATSEEAIARVERQRVNRVISGALAALRPRDRKVFVLQTIEGWSHERIAEQHGMSIHAVRNLAWRARRTLRRSLESERIWNWGWIFPVGGLRRRQGTGGSWRKWRLRSWTNGSLEGTAAERAAAFVLGLAAASASLLGGAESPERLPEAVEFGSVRTVPMIDPDATQPEPSRQGNTEPSTHRSTPPPPPGIVVASVSFAAPDEGAAAPPGAKAGVEVRSPRGDTLIWYQHHAQCDGQASAVLPDAGPVRVVC